MQTFTYILSILLVAAANTTTIQSVLQKNGTTIVDRRQVQPTNDGRKSLGNRVLEGSDIRRNIEEMKSKLKHKAKQIQFLKEKLFYMKNETGNIGDGWTNVKDEILLGIYSIKHPFGPLYIPHGEFPIVFTNIDVTNVFCINSTTKENICLVDNKSKFLSHTPHLYRFEIGVHVMNSYNTSETSWPGIDVKENKTDGSDPEIIRQFRDYTPFDEYNARRYNTRRYMVYKFDHYMDPGTTLWLENLHRNTIVVGPEQYKFTWMAYQYYHRMWPWPNETSIDSLQANE